jgi:hypothetical protein
MPRPRAKLLGIAQFIDWQMDERRFHSAKPQHGGDWLGGLFCRPYLFAPKRIFEWRTAEIEAELLQPLLNADAKRHWEYELGLARMNLQQLEKEGAADREIAKCKRDLSMLKCGPEKPKFNTRSIDHRFQKEAAYEFHWFEEHHLDMGRFVADNADLWVLIAEALEIAASRLVRKQRWGRKRARKVDALQRRLIEIARCSQGLARLSEGHPEWTAKRQNAWLLERIIEPGLANSMEYIPASGVWDGYCNSEFDSFDCRSYLTGRADRRLIRNGF